MLQRKMTYNIAGKSSDILDLYIMTMLLNINNLLQNNVVAYSNHIVPMVHADYPHK